MTPEECRLERATLDELDARAEDTDMKELRAQVAVMSGQALWEIAAQLSRANQHTQYILIAHGQVMASKIVGVVKGHMGGMFTLQQERGLRDAIYDALTPTVTKP